MLTFIVLAEWVSGFEYSGWFGDLAIRAVGGTLFR